PFQRGDRQDHQLSRQWHAPVRRPVGIHPSVDYGTPALLEARYSCIDLFSQIPSGSCQLLCSGLSVELRRARLSGQSLRFPEYALGWSEMRNVCGRQKKQVLVGMAKAINEVCENGIVAVGKQNAFPTPPLLERSRRSC